MLLGISPIDHLAPVGFHRLVLWGALELKAWISMNLDWFDQSSDNFRNKRSLNSKDQNFDKSFSSFFIRTFVEKML